MAVGQSVPLLHYTTKDGLPSNIVYYAYVDSKGYTWFATDKGIARYNGDQYTIYTTADGLPDNEVFAFQEDGLGRLWLFTFKGVLCYFKDGKFYTAAQKPWMAIPKSRGPFYIKFSLEKDSTLTGVSNDNKSLLFIKGERLYLYSLDWFHSKYPDLGMIVDIKKISANRFRLYFPRKYFDIDIKQNTDTELAYPFKSQVHGYNSPNGFLMSYEGVYTPEWKKLYSFTKGGHALNVKAIKYDNNLFTNLDSTLSVNGRLLLGNAYVTQLTRDNSGNYWISTKGDGVYYLSKHLFNLIKYPDIYGGKVRDAGLFNGNLVFVTDWDWFYKLSRGENKVQNLYADHASTEKKQFYNINYLITDSSSYLRFHELSNFLLRVFPDGHAEKKRIGTLWIWWDKQNKSIRVIKDIKKDENNIYLFTISSLLRVNYTDLFRQGINNKLDTLISAKDDNNNRISARALNPRDHSLWLSRNDGVVVMQDGRFIPQPGFRNIIFRQFDFWGDYLVGRTDDNKLLVCNNYNGQVLIDTLVDKNCIWENIYPIDKYHAIIVTNNYNRLLTLFPVSPGAKPSYTLKIIENPFLPKEAEYVKADSTFCYFFENGSVTRLPTPLLFEQVPPPITIFTAFRARGKTYPIGSQITIPYTESKSISIAFDNISFTSKDISCEYAIVDNGKEEWIKMSGNEINLNTPSFGNYTIKVRAKTLSSDYSKPVILKLTILRPFWATWWFITLCILVLIVLVWSIVLLITRRKLRKKQQQFEADMKYQQSEYKALNALMNPHFIFNSLNNIQGLINKDEKRIANEYLVIFADLVRQNMHNISKGFISLQQELNLVENYLNLEKLRFKELVNYELQVDEEVEADVIMIPPLMIQPLVENAVKHGLLPRESNDSLIHIHVYERDDRLYIEIKDNGVGLTKSLQSKNRLYESFGLSNLKKRTEHLKKIQQHDIDIEVNELKDENGNSKGTRALIVMELESS